MVSVLQYGQEVLGLRRPAWSPRQLCFMGCALSYELGSGDSLIALTGVSENESVDCLTGSLPARLVTRRPTCTNSGQIGVSENGEIHTAVLVKQLVQSLSAQGQRRRRGSKWSNSVRNLPNLSKGGRHIIE